MYLIVDNVQLLEDTPELSALLEIQKFTGECTALLHNSELMSHHLLFFSTGARLGLVLVGTVASRFMFDAEQDLLQVYFPAYTPAELQQVFDITERSCQQYAVLLQFQ